MEIRLLIVEDEDLLRYLLVRILGQTAGVDVIGSTEDGASAIVIAREEEADVVLMDIELRDEPDGITAARHIKEDNPATGIVFLSAHRHYVSQIPFDQGSGWAYLAKQSVSDLSTVMRAVEATASGLNVVDPAIVRSLNPARSPLLGSLTARQLEILRLMTEGYSNRGIAEGLGLRPQSVERHTNRIYSRLAISRNKPVHPRVQAVLAYLRETLAL